MRYFDRYGKGVIWWDSQVYSSGLKEFVSRHVCHSVILYLIYYICIFNGEVYGEKLFPIVTHHWRIGFVSDNSRIGFLGGNALRRDNFRVNFVSDDSRIGVLGGNELRLIAFRIGILSDNSDNCRIGFLSDNSDNSRTGCLGGGAMSLLAAHRRSESSPQSRDDSVISVLLSSALEISSALEMSSAAAMPSVSVLSSVSVMSSSGWVVVDDRCGLVVEEERRQRE